MAGVIAGMWCRNEERLRKVVVSLMTLSRVQVVLPPAEGCPEM